MSTLFVLMSIAMGFAQKIDTLRVYQSDTLHFNKQVWTPLQCGIALGFSRKIKPQIEYTLKTPKENTYYYIYNDQKQLVREGLLKEHNGESKTYTYKKNGKLYTVKYQGIKVNKVEFYHNGKIRKRMFFDAKTGDYLKIEELYKNNKLKLQINYEKGNTRAHTRKYFDKKSGNLIKLELYEDYKLKSQTIYGKRPVK